MQYLWGWMIKKHAVPNCVVVGIDFYGASGFSWRISTIVCYMRPVRSWWYYTLYRRTMPGHNAQHLVLVFSCDQAALLMVQSVCPSVCLLHLLTMFPSSWNFQEFLPRTEVTSMQKVKVRGQRSRSQRSAPNLAWSSIEEVPYCFSRSSIIFQGHTAKKIYDFDPNWAFPDCNSNLKSLMAMKWCTKLEAT